MQKIIPNWLVPKHLHAFTTTRTGGVSQAPFDSFNLGDHVGDELERVQQNRKHLVALANLPQFPLFLNQTHSTKVIRLPYQQSDLEADAVYTDKPNQVCLVMTADCLPVLFCNQQGNEVAAAHAGWRGLCDGILEATVAEFKSPTEQIQAWLGPAIGPTAFQVGEEVVEQFCAVDPQARQAFINDPNASGKFLGNLYQLAQMRLQKLGISQILGGDFCTYNDRERFFSYRRDHKTGRMASLIWFGE